MLFSSQMDAAAQARARLNLPGQTAVDDGDAEAQKKAEVEAQALDQAQADEHAAQRHLRQLQAEDEDDLSFYRKKASRRLSAGWSTLEDEPS